MQEANIMKAFRLLLLLWLPLTLFAQNASPAGAPDLLIIDYKLGPFMRIDVSGPDSPQGSQADPLTQAQASVTTATGREPPRYQTKLKPEIKVQNAGSRTIKSIDCEFLLKTRPGQPFVLSAFTMHFSKTLRPGDTGKFSKPMRADHLGMWRQRQKEGSMSVSASIIRVEYDDGSVWERGPLRLQSRD
jgi:hypothetical protein